MKSKASSADQIREAFKKGSNEIFGFDIKQKYCHEYEDNSIPIDVFIKLNMHYEDYEVEEVNGVKVIEIDTDEWVNIYATIANIGDPSLKIEIISCSSIAIGGYGLFHC